MNRFLVVGFEYNNNTDYCLARLQAGKEVNQYAVTVMNGELEKILFGHHYIKEENGSLLVEKTDSPERDRLKRAITNALGRMLAMPVKLRDAISRK